MDRTLPAPFPTSFNRREIEILFLISEGFSNAAIAHKLSLSSETIKWYNNQIFSKLGVKSRTQAIREARECGLLDMGSGSAKHNLPRQITRFIGREAEIGQVKALLEKAPLVTLTGSGGVGKSRLSIQVAAVMVHNYADGIWFIELASLTNPSLLSHTVARTLGLVEEARRPLDKILAAYLRPKQTLLVLDNCEHLIEACANLVAYLLGNCPRLNLLVSSREALGLPGEAIYCVPSMQIPDPQLLSSPEDFQSIEAVQLFIERARDVLPSFKVDEGNRPAIADICRRLDGIPLAIELAAARMNMLTTDQLASRLDHAFSVLHGRRPASLPRHQTLRAAIEWTYQLLSAEERRLLRELSVFSGGWNLEAAEAICMDEGLGVASLVNKSVVAAVRTQGQETRYRLLETVRQYAWEKLARAGEAERLRDRHLSYFARWAEATSPKLHTFEQRVALRQLKAEHDNLHSALHWALETAGPGRAEEGLRLASALGNYWDLISAFREGCFWLEKALSATVADRLPWALYRAQALSHVFHLKISRIKVWDTQPQLVDESLSISREFGDLAGQGKAMVRLGILMTFEDYARGCMVIDEGIRLARQSGDLWILAMILQWTGLCAKGTNRGLVKARACLEESLAIFSAMGDRWNRAEVLAVLSWVATMQGDLTAAKAYMKEGTQNILDEFEEFEFKNSSGLVQTAYYLGDYTQMDIIIEVCVEKARKVADELALIYYMRISGAKARGQGDLHSAAKIFLESVLNAQDYGDVYGVYAGIGWLAGVALDSGQPVLAARLLGAVEALFETFNKPQDEFDQAQFKRDAGAARRQLDSDAFSDAWSFGRGQTLEWAIREAQAI